MPIREWAYAVWGACVAFDVFLNDSKLSILTFGLGDVPIVNWLVFLFNAGALIYFGLAVVALCVGLPGAGLQTFVRIFRRGLKAEQEDKKRQ